MRPLIATWRLLRMLVHLLHGLALMALRFPSLDAAARLNHIRWWSAKLLRVTGLTLHSQGTAHAGASLLLANHVSWLDIAAIHAVAPHVRFVSKADVLGWPLLGWMIRNAGTLFIERERKRDALRVLHQIGAALSAGDVVVVFPEGTTGSGRELLPFHANLLQAAISTGTPVQGVALRYSDARQAISPAVEFVGDTTLLQSVRRVLCARGLSVSVNLLPALPSVGSGRRALAEQVRQQIDAALQHERPRPTAAHAARTRQATP